jgi:hypothetical protein
MRFLSSMTSTHVVLEQFVSGESPSTSFPHTDELLLLRVDPFVLFDRTRITAGVRTTWEITFVWLEEGEQDSLQS